VSVLVFVEPDDDLSLQAVGFARALGEVRAVTVEGVYAPASWAAAIAAAADGADTIVAAGSDRGNELLAHVAAQLDQPFAANVTAIDGDVVTRVRWGGSLLEEARLHGSPRILTVAPHTHPAGEAPPSTALTVPGTVNAVPVLERVEESNAGVSLRDAKVVVSGGRGVGSAEGFGPIEELAQLLGAAAPASSRAPAGARTPTRSARPGRRSPPTSTSRAGSAARRSTSPARRARRRSSRSTPTRRRRSSASPTTASSATCTRSSPRSPPS